MENNNTSEAELSPTRYLVLAQGIGETAVAGVFLSGGINLIEHSDALAIPAIAIGVAVGSLAVRAFRRFMKLDKPYGDSE
jgi:hypothetical protein